MAMFYADAILSKKSPLARVWLAAHYERKLSKAQTLQTDIAQSTKAIESRPLALRISGQLLLGVCRIYSRKAKYLLDDCNEALVKIKLAFRPGVVDMTDEQLTVPANAITLQGAGFDIDLFGDTWAFEASRMTGGKHLAREADINLPMQEDFMMNLDGGAEWNLDLEDGGFGELDLNFGEPTLNDLDEDSMAIEIPRDAVQARSARESLASAIRGKADITEADIFSRDSGDFADTDMNLGDMGDLALDFGDVMGNLGDDAGGDQSEATSRPSSPSEIQEPTTPKDNQIEEDTPKKIPKKRKLKEKKQVIDSVTELRDSGKAKGVQNGLSFTKVDVSSIITDHGFLPRSETVMRLLDIRADPLAHFFPIKTTEAGSFYCFAPPGLAPEISDLFLFPAVQGAGQKRKGQAQNERAAKRQRLQSEPVDDVELLRGAGGALSSPAPYDGAGADGFNDESGFLPNDLSIPGEDFQFQIDDSLHLDKQVSSRNVTPAPDPFDETNRIYADEACPVAVFDTQPQTHEPSLTTSPQRPGNEQDDEQVNKDGYSRNTVKAIGLLRSELESTRGGKKGTLSFAEMTEKGSRRAASSFFFELLLLGTRDCVKLGQKKAFGDIAIQGKKKLWEGQLTE